MSKIFRLFFSLAFTIAALSASAADFVTSSVLSDGRWIKVNIDATGVHRISYETLREWGFTHPERVAVYGYGSVESSMPLATAPDDLPAVGTLHRDGALYFYAEGDVRLDVKSLTAIDAYRNHYSYGSHYFLTEDAPATGIAESVSTPAESTETVNSHISLIYHEPEEYNPTSGGVFWYSKPIRNDEKITVDIPMPDCMGDASVSYIAIAKNPDSPFSPELKAGSNVSLLGRQTVQINRAADSKDYYSYMHSPDVIPFSLNSGNRTTFTIGIPSAQRDNTDFLSLDALWVLYSRANVFPADSAQLTMHFLSGNATASLNPGATSPSNLLLWDVTTPREPKSVATRADADGRLLFDLPTSDSPLRLVAFNTQAPLPEPQFVGEVTNSNLHALRGYDMIIVTSAEFMDAARRLADLHAREQGLNVAVADKADIFNEFSSGNFTANSIRLFAKMLHRRDNRLKYVLLLGGGNYDNRSVASETGPYLPTYQIEGRDNARNIAKALTCDLYFGFIEDTLTPDITQRDNPAKPRYIDIAVGRIPVLSASEVEIAVDKITDYMTDNRHIGAPARALMMTDLGNNNQHLKGTESSVEVATQFNPSMTFLKAYQAAFKLINGVNSSLHRYTKTAFASSPAFIYYAGHASQDNLFSDSFFNRNYADALQFSNNPVFFLAACFPYSFDYNYRGIASELLLRRDGPISVVGTAREVYLTSNQVFSDVFVENYYTCAPGSTIGDIHRRSLNDILVSTQLHRTNALNYNLGSDPAIPVPRRTYDVTMTSAEPTFHPGAATVISGEIRDFEGNIVTDFNGRLTAELFNAPRSFLSYANTSDDNNAESRMTLKIDDDVLASVTCEVKSGRWSATLTPAVNVPDNFTGRLGFHALPESGFNYASGTTSATMGAYSAALVTPDTDAPSLTLELLDAVTVSGEIETSRTPTVSITVSDTGSGISNASQNIGSNLSVHLDGSTNLDNIAALLTSDVNGVYTATYPLTDLSDGRHTLTATISDKVGNTTSASLDFVVVEPSVDCSIHPESDIVSSQAHFRILHSLTSAPEGRIIIEDMAGHHVMSRQLSGDSFTWDLRGDDGQLVTDGTYHVYAVIKSHPRFGSTAKARFTVIR